MSVSVLMETYAHEIRQKSEGHIELELRFVIPSKNEYISLLKNILAKRKTASISRSVNFLKFNNNQRVQGSRSNESWIATMQYAEHVKRGASIIEKSGALQFSGKKRITSVPVNDDFVPYKIVISRETHREKYDVDSFSMMRVKNRISIFVPEMDKWRFDFTLIASPININKLPEVRRLMFPVGMTVDNFLKSAPILEADKLEFEVEYVGGDDEKDSIMTTDIYNVVDFIRESGNINYTNNVQYQTILYDIAKLIYNESKAENFKRKHGLKSFGPSPKGLDKNMYFKNVLPNITDYLIGEKADGENIIGYIKGTTWYTLGSDIKTVELDRKYDQPTIYQAEMANGIHYIHDVMMYNGDKIAPLPITKRATFNTHVVKMLPPGAAVDKQHTLLTTEYAMQMKSVYDGEYPYDLDGLIFTHKDKGWANGEMYKWKPSNELKIDMLVIEPPSSGVIGIAPHVNIPGHRLLFLFCGISKHQSNTTHHIRRIEGYGKMFNGRKFFDYWPIQFSPISDPTVYIYHHPNDDKRNIIGHICEFARVGDIWELDRIRTDRDIEVARGSYFGNNIAVAESIWNNIKSPLTFDMLRSSMIEVVDQMNMYFSKTDTRYRPANAFSSYVKEQSITGIEKIEWIVDLAAGRGADLGRWSRHGIKNALCIDNDIDALKELKKRQQSAQRGIGHYKTTVYTHLADLTCDFKDISQTIKNKYPIPPDGVQLAICNMAIHYFCETNVIISNFVMLVDSIIAKNGIFIFTCYNGRRVFDTLRGKEKYQLFENGVLKYSIKNAFLGSSFQSTGLKIETLLGFADGKHRMEYLVDIDYVIKLFRARGFKLVKKQSFGEHLADYSIDNLENYDKMTDADIRHVSLYDYVIVEKIKNVDGGNDVKEIQDDQSFIVHKPIVVIPTRKTATTIKLNDVTMNTRGSIQTIVIINTVALQKIQIGDRVSINSNFDVVVKECRSFPTYRCMLETYTPADLGSNDNEDTMIINFRRRFAYKSETKRGVIAIKMMRL
jgi:ASC-1-like (ASCH) protein